MPTDSVSRPDVALISPYPRLGARHDGDSGVASYAANLAHALTDAGARVTVVAPEHDGEPALGRDGAVEVRRAFRAGVPNAVPAALAAARATGAAQVHLQHELFLYSGASGLPATVAGLAAHRRVGPPTAITMHQVVDPAAVTHDYTAMHRVRVPPFAARRAIGGVQRLLPALADTVLVHEPSFQRVIPRATVVPHGIEVPAPSAEPRAAVRRRLGVREHGLVALCFGFVAPYKGLEVSLAAAQIAGAGPGGPLQVVVAGGEHPRLAAQGDDYQDRLARRFGESATFTGYVPDELVGDWFRAADVLLLAYPEPHASSGPLALALAHRTPVLLSERLADVVGAHRDLAVPTAPEAWAARLRELAHDPAGPAVQRLRGHVEAMAADRSWPAVARRHLELYPGLGPRTPEQEVTRDDRAAAADHAHA
ncbi:glycosyltransferase [Nocardioides ferulae]|uniref:glycosyltransferase n=1 Tax=Nocardioides ferulae TaxID=2340821 RepID=UPI000EB3C2DC|nr:glycosyltransferase [Nocardioides ferulae]